MSNSLDPQNVDPDLVTNCLERLSGEDKDVIASKKSIKDKTSIDTLNQCLLQ